MKNFASNLTVSVVATLIASVALTASASAATVSYTANLNTSVGNPVTDILIGETDGTSWELDYPFELPGTGTSTLTHNVDFTPTQSLVVGLTVGVDDEGNDKTQIVMFLDDAFAAANAGEKFSVAFPNTRHSVLISNLQAAVRDGDAGQHDWFRETFFPGDGAAAAFDTGGSFSVGEFTALNVIGTNATAGNWSVDNLQDIVDGLPLSQSGLPTSVLDETASDAGPFDVEFETTVETGTFAIEANIVNNSGAAWSQVELILGTGLGDDFEPSTSIDDIRFTDNSLVHEDQNGAFSSVQVEEDRLVFSGLLAAGESAKLVSFLSTSSVPQDFTFRQVATLVPEPTALTLGALGLMSLCSAIWRRRGPKRLTSTASFRLGSFTVQGR